MSEADGSTPGTMEGSLRHPEGTHEGGTDFDVAYFQTGSDNLARAVCPDNDGTECTGPANLLNARHTAFFMAQLMRSASVELIAVDTMVGTAVRAAAADLVDDGVLEPADLDRIETRTASGTDWPYMHDHMHVSWTPSR